MGMPRFTGIPDTRVQPMLFAFVDAKDTLLFSLSSSDDLRSDTAKRKERKVAHYPFTYNLCSVWSFTGRRVISA